jgi:surfeit locus 1 family protein
VSRHDVAAADASAPARPLRASRPAWIPFVAMVAVVALCVTAGNWQRHRMHEKESLAAALAQARARAPVALPLAADWPAWRYRQVVAEGRYDADTQFLLDNRVHDGVVGYDVITPLALRDGTYVLVDRGFVPTGGDRRTLPRVPPPPGEVHVQGTVELPPRPLPFGSAEPDGVRWPRLDPARYAERTSRRVLPVYLAATGGDVGAGLARDWPAPDLGIEQHMSYMVQWYTFAALAAGLWVWFAWRRRSVRA